MKRLKQYFFLECKKMFFIFPKFFLGCSILCFLAFLCFYGIRAGSKKQAEQNKIHIGIVSQKDEPFIDWIIKTLQNMPDMGFSFEIEKLGTDEPVDDFFSDDSSVLFLVPKNYIRSILYGENKHLTIRFSKTQTTVVHALMQELCHAASSFILDTEAAIYTMQDYYDKYKLTNKDTDELLLNIKYVEEIATMSQGIEPSTQTPLTEYPDTANYFAAGLVILVFLFGLIPAPALTSEKKEFRTSLSLIRLGAEKQVLARGMAYFVLLSFLVLMIAFLYLAANAAGLLSFPETVLEQPSGVLLFFLEMLPVLLAAGQFTILLYELAGDMLSSILLLFFSSIFMGLFSGCFYPLQYLPTAVQKLSAYLPSTYAKDYLLKGILGDFDSKDFFILILYAAGFYLVSVWNCRIKEKS